MSTNSVMENFTSICVGRKPRDSVMGFWLAHVSKSTLQFYSLCLSQKKAFAGNESLNAAVCK